MKQKRVELLGYKNLSTITEQRVQCVRNYLHFLTIVYVTRLVINQKIFRVCGTCVILKLC